MNTHPFLLCALLFLSIASSLAQDVTGNLEGCALDMQGDPLPSANIIVKSPSFQGLRGTSTEETGHFRLLALPVGVYTIEVRLISFRAVVLRDLRIQLGQTTTICDVRLEPESVELGEVVISGERPLIDPQQPSADL